MFQIENRLITADIEVILKKVKAELTNGKLSSFRRTSSGVKVTCPVHSEGKERNESCYISDEGMWHCFTCGASGKFESFIGECFDSTHAFGKEWLIERYGNTVVQTSLTLPEINLSKISATNFYLDESILDSFQNYHPYMTQRKLTSEVIEKFKIKYDAETKSIVFPVWNDKGKLFMLTRRSVLNKTFLIDKDKEKPVYLLNFIKQENIKSVYIAESQLNALTLWSWNYPAVALFGTGTKHQYDLLAKSGIRHYILCFDGDSAGDRGTANFIKNLEDKGALISIIKIPRGKDVNDLTKEEFDNLVLTI